MTKSILIVSIVCFVLAAFGVSFTHVQLVPLGLAFYVLHKLV